MSEEGESKNLLWWLESYYRARPEETNMTVSYIVALGKIGGKRKKASDLLWERHDEILQFDYSRFGDHNKYQQNYDMTCAKEGLNREIQQQVLKHIEGHIVGPTVVALGMGGMFHKYFMEASFMPEEFHQDAESFGKLLDFFAQSPCSCELMFMQIATSIGHIDLVQLV